MKCLEHKSHEILEFSFFIHTQPRTEQPTLLFHCYTSYKPEKRNSELLHLFAKLKMENEKRGGKAFQEKSIKSSNNEHAFHARYVIQGSS